MAAGRFSRFIGIDYSGARTPEASLPGLRVYECSPGREAVEVAPPPSPRTYWTRRGLAAWLADALRAKAPTLVGIDHAFSFPWRYFEEHDLAPDWPAFLADFHRHWPTDGRGIYVDFVREGELGDGAARSGDARWRRLTDRRCGAKSVFHFDVPGSVAKSTHAGLPWLLAIRQGLGRRIHFWPFDGWRPPAHRSVLAEVYPSLWSAGFPRCGRTPDQHDAYSVAEWLRRADADGRLDDLLAPDLTPDEKATARVEGWILGVG